MNGASVTLASDPTVAPRGIGAAASVRGGAPIPAIGGRPGFWS
jgi:hypothetical protein